LTVDNSFLFQRGPPRRGKSLEIGNNGGPVFFETRGCRPLDVPTLGSRPWRFLFDKSQADLVGSLGLVSQATLRFEQTRPCLGLRRWMERFFFSFQGALPCRLLSARKDSRLAFHFCWQDLVAAATLTLSLDFDYDCSPPPHESGRSLRKGRRRRRIRPYNSLPLNKNTPIIPPLRSINLGAFTPVLSFFCLRSHVNGDATIFSQNRRFSASLQFKRPDSRPLIATRCFAPAPLIPPPTTKPGPFKTVWVSLGHPKLCCVSGRPPLTFCPGPRFSMQQSGGLAGPPQSTEGDIIQGAGRRCRGIGPPQS